MKFVMTQAVCPEGMALLKNVADVWVADNPDPNNYLEAMRNADALIVRLAQCNGNAIDSSPNLRVIGRTGVGCDTVDVKKATERGIPVVITPGANNRSVAEHAVAMMFAISKNLVEGQIEMMSGTPAGSPHRGWEIRGAGKAFELEGKTVGLIGLGAIGRETAKLCRACGMKLAGYDPFLNREQIEALGVAYYSDYEALLKDVDIVTVHVPLTEGTRDMIGARQLAAMKRSAILINCSRGGIVNEADLVKALKGKVIAGAGTDVYCNEPPRPDDPLLHCPNLVISPHSAAQTREAVVRMARMCVIGCLSVLEGKKWPHVADRTVYDHPIWAGREWAETN